MNEANRAIEAVYRAQSGRVLASLIRLLGGMEAAEEALLDAFAAAARQWPHEGVPRNPVSWLISAGRFKAIDRMRRNARFDAAQAELLRQVEEALEVEPTPQDIADDHLRLIFTCCHPALPPDAQLALTLREVCGLSTEDVARAFLVPTPTIAQRIVRAKNRIRDEQLPYQVPTPPELPARLAIVLHVIYLLFNEGYSPASGEAGTRPDVSGEALRLGQVLFDLLPEPEVGGLLALMMVHEARRPGRLSPEGDIVLLADQDRTLWDHETIARAGRIVAGALRTPRPGPYAIQAAIAALHAEPPTADDTDWVEIAGLYDLLMRVAPSPVVALNRAVAIAMRDGPEAGLRLVEDLIETGELSGYHLAHAARADLCRRLGRPGEARDAYRRALDLARQEPERRFLARRLAELDA
ncbi:DNA-directed RNA polymerase sigma-70 factor [Youhaiella tibetensis]|uniref:RNA polymerase sigma factor n=1 Tax=Paradevosia tibetensis TaxID=1447062 RepID=A0A5B9DJL5_9HYPH|nr:RNA polymerase sigma factor [Youhaiella tibetensis]QEE19022.1 RNA polymerase sigma factor [Youhaiella tibetensis]GGF36980.1 DNA-directed RNA polymerase sigma-70 factor [Youhaiella tibetensis]